MKHPSMKKKTKVMRDKPSLFPSVGMTQTEGFGMLPSSMAGAIALQQMNRNKPIKSIIPISMAMGEN